ncbi:MAG TPA: oxygen-independent coproporphyrinogen III oxidase [Aeromonadales bacterium]|nr:oxygen-independent coproporphyrinogen III oxidase [Aeromonadales bacterium]
MASKYFSRALIDKYNISGPRYTSYPTAVEFHGNFQAADFSNGIRQSDATKPVSLYIHVPFCDTLCYYCACNKVITRDYTKSVQFIDKLKKEMALIAPLIKDRQVLQMHWGGGTPTFLTDEQIQDIIQFLHDNFTMLNNDEGEYGIEIDPRAVTPERIRNLREMGFNRLSLGVQDVNPEVQKAVHRIQPNEITEGVLNTAREVGFVSTNLDLIYGLPFQNETSFDQTLDQVLQWRPDRLSVFNYAHLPHLFKPQKRILAEDLPSADEKLNILDNAISKLSDNGYDFIGMDHFALPDDELSLAQKDGSLHRNFQGYTTHGECDLIGFGPSAISQVGQVYSQNLKTLDEYYDSLDKNNLPVWRGKILDEDDLIRRAVIVQLICQFQLEFDDINQQFAIDFQSYFADELSDYKAMQKDNLLTVDEKGIKIHAPGRLLIRNICMIFDKYLQRMQRQISFSKTI